MLTVWGRQTQTEVHPEDALRTGRVWGRWHFRRVAPKDSEQLQGDGMLLF